jgi:hypothetical protein
MMMRGVQKQNSKTITSALMRFDSPLFFSRSPREPLRVLDLSYSNF